MKKTRGILLIVWILLGVFVCAGSASAANETGRDGRFVASRRDRSGYGTNLEA